MDKKIKRLLENLHSSARGLHDLHKDKRELLESQIFQLADAIDQMQRTYEAAVRQAGPRSARGEFYSEPAGQNILRRAMAADPVRTEHDLIALGAHTSLSIIGAQHQAEQHRAEQRREGAQTRLSFAPASP